MTAIENVSRRNFIKAAGITSGGFILGINLPLSAKTLDPAKAAASTLNFFVSIANDGIVSIVCHRSEMGQGIRTSVPQIIADELGANWDKVNVVQAKADAKYGSQGTAGSASIRSHFTTIRQMGAIARDMLEQAAASIWQVDKSAVKAGNHVVTHSATGQQISFAELAPHAAKLTPLDAKNVTLKNTTDFSLIGKDVSLTDLNEIVAGQATYAQDIQLPNMLIATIVRPPVVGGKVLSFDASQAKKIKGVVDVIALKPRSIPVATNPLSGVAVLATNTWAALEGRKKLTVEWDLGANSTHSSESHKQALVKKVNQQGSVAAHKGDIYTHQYQSENTLEATYTVPYNNHSPMETPAATAIVTDEKCTIWAGTQNPQWAQGIVATELGYSQEEHHKIELNITLMGGAFGRKSKADFIVEAVELAKATKRPVKVIWSREDDIQHGYYQSIAANYHKAELTANGSADFWISRVAYPPIGWLWNADLKSPQPNDLALGFGDIPFALNNLSLETQESESYVRPGWLRSVACINNGFALGSFVDELAVKANLSTRQMWLNLLGDDRHVNPSENNYEYNNYNLAMTEHPLDTKRMKSLINLICDKAEVEKPLPKNQGWGISFLRSFGSFVAAATKVEVTNNKVTVLAMHTAIDCGIVVTPDRVTAQMEGAMIMGLSIALMGEISVKDGVVEQSNFHDAPVTRIHQVPELYVHIVQSDAPPGGVGEPGVPPIIPSITNAIYHASNIRIRDLPVNKVLTV
ncbi:molybdopterin-dependent oxidoreductase [Colwellia asteriadis]|uniref:Molybdopterin-dependent oxidoreductase n=1 Tax=Colwellia asteriadis TaxID=517723 RepID=A0ABN1L759_9GAMM